MTHKEIKKICRKYDITGYSINKGGSVDIDGDLDLDGYNLKKLPLKFNIIYGSFECVGNYLTSLGGSPTEVRGDFDCSSNELCTLVGGPKIVSGDYFCLDNHLDDFCGFPEHFYGEVYTRGYPVEELMTLVDGDNYKSNYVKFIKWLNEYDVIRDRNKIVEMRLEEAYWMTMRKELPKNKRNFAYYQLI